MSATIIAQIIPIKRRWWLFKLYVLLGQFILGRPFSNTTSLVSKYGVRRAVLLQCQTCGTRSSADTEWCPGCGKRLDLQESRT